MNHTTAILVTGKIYPEHLHRCMECYKHTTTLKFASIWNNEDTTYIQQLIDTGFIVIQNDIKQQEQFVPQFIPIVNGLNFIKEKYSTIEFVLRTRFDILSFDFDRYLEDTYHLYKEKITVLSGIHTTIVYFLQIIESGPIHEMLKFYGLQSIHDTRCPERFLLENYTHTSCSTHNEIKNVMHFSLDICVKNNIEFIWIRPATWKSNIRTIPDMKVIHEYCRDYFIWL